MSLRAGSVAVVTDSSACLPVDLAAAHDVIVVPLRVVLGGRELPEPEVDSDELVECLRRKESVTTSSPSPRALRAAYAAAAAAGASSVLSLHLSESWSGTLAAARSAAAEASLPVRVLDSGTVAMPLGWAALDAATAAAGGAELDEVAAVAGATARNAALWLVVPTLDHLRRSGRIGTGSALLGSALGVKPILRVHDGSIDRVDKVRTLSRALDRLVEIASVQLGRLAAGGHPGSEVGSAGVRVVVHAMGDLDRAGELALRLQGIGAVSSPVRIVGVGAGVGAHVGPGVLAVAVAPAVHT